MGKPKLNGDTPTGYVITLIQWLKIMTIPSWRIEREVNIVKNEVF